MPATLHAPRGKHLSCPTPEHLHSLLRMCGSEQGVVNLLAKSYGLSPDAIDETVRQWLSDLPGIVPPSRQRSAPPIFCAKPPSALITMYPPSASRGAEVLPIRTPPASAPVKSGAELVTAMRALNHRLNQRVSTRAPLSVLSSQRVSFEAGLARREVSVPDAVPEEGVAANDQALADFMERAALMRGGIAPTAAGVQLPGGGRATHAGWNYY
jgi:hypothetical protein